MVKYVVVDAVAPTLGVGATASTTTYFTIVSANGATSFTGVLNAAAVPTVATLSTGFGATTGVIASAAALAAATQFLPFGIPALIYKHVNKQVLAQKLAR